MSKAVPDTAAHTLAVSFDDAATSLDAIKASLAGAGFTVTEPPAASPPSPPSAISIP